MRDYYLVIAKDCVAIMDMHGHLRVASLETMRAYFGIVAHSSRIIDAGVSLFVGAPSEKSIIQAGRSPGNQIER